MPNAEGSGVTLRYVQAVLPACILFLCACSSVSADTISATLTWTSGGPQDQRSVQITDGGTYSVPLGVSGTAQLDLSEKPSPCFLVIGSLYRIDDNDPTQRTLVASGIPYCPPGGAPASVTWPSAGSYELDVTSLAPPGLQVFQQTLMRRFAWLFFGDVADAFALPSPPVLVATIHFTITDASVCTQNCFSNVLFLPGVEASRLYGNDGSGEQKLWEPGSLLQSGDAAAVQLAMNPDGTSVRPDIYTRDVFDNAYVPLKGNVYESFIADMNQLKSDGTINDWEPIAYDWRLPLDQILSSGAQTGQNISYLTATDTPFIIQELQRLAASSKTGKVIIVAHSNGGLLAKALMQKIGADETAKLIDKVIFVASPQVGTPSAVAGLLHGYQADIPFFWNLVALSPATARQIGDTMPGLYNLLPSASYFTYVDDPVVTFATGTLPDWAARYGDVIHSQGNLETFLSDASRAQPNTKDLLDPTILNDSFVAQAETVHDSLDTWTPPAGVQVIQIAGWGIPTTVSGINYDRTTENGVTSLGFDPTFTLDGDGTVVVPSALWMSTTTGAEDYWVDVGRYSDDNRVSTAGGAKGLFPFEHRNILEVGPLLNFINDEITDSVKSLSAYVYISDKSLPSSNMRLVYALHSPLTLNLYDGQGNHTGVSTTTGEIDEEVPGTYYTEFGDVKYVFTDGSEPAHIVMNGYDSGTFTFDITELQGSVVVASTTFADIPTTANTTVTMDVSGSISDASPMRVDENGDGNVDLILDPGGIVTSDQSAATTTNSTVIENSQPATGGGNGPPAATPVTVVSPLASVFPAPPSTSTLPASTTQPQAHIQIQTPKSTSSTRAIAVTRAAKTGQSKPARSVNGNDKLVAGAAASLNAEAFSTRSNYWKFDPRWFQSLYQKVKIKLYSLIP